MAPDVGGQTGRFRHRVAQLAALREHGVAVVAESVHHAQLQVASLDVGAVDAHTALSLTSEMSEGGVVFADGIETDRIDFVSGRRVQLRIAERRLNLVVPAG